MKISKIMPSQWMKIFKAALYVGVSAAVSFVISLIADNPDLFGQLTPLVNVLLVMAKQAVTKAKK